MQGQAGAQSVWQGQQGSATGHAGHGHGATTGHGHGLAQGQAAFAACIPIDKATTANKANNVFFIIQFSFSNINFTVVLINSTSISKSFIL